MKNCIPSYFNNKQNSILLVLSTTIFAELFILIFTPFQSRLWVESDWQFLGWVSLVVLVAMGTIAISRTILYHYAKKHQISYARYGVWIFTEISIMSLIYTLFPLLVLSTFAEQKGLEFFQLFKEAFLDTAFILLIPYTIMILLFEVREKNAYIQHITGASSDYAQPDMYNFYDEKGELKLSAKPETIYYIESADNYVIIHYISTGKKEKLMIRNTLKNIEWRFRDTQLVRCHRSFIVNLSKVQIMRRQEGDVVLDFGEERVAPIPVSKGYGEKVISHFANRINPSN